MERQLLYTHGLEIEPQTPCLRDLPPVSQYVGECLLTLPMNEPELNN